MVLLTVFGSMFASGLFVVFQSFGWGLFEIVAGLFGLIVLIRDHLKRLAVNLPKVPNRLPRLSFQTAFLLFASAAISIFVGHTISQIMTIQTTVTQYVLPRSVSQKQVDSLRDFLSLHKPYSVTVRVNPLDGEAMEYAGQLFNALHGTEWTAEMNTSNQEPNTLNPGLCIDEIGMNSRPKIDPTHSPADLLQQGFRAANIEVNCGGGSSAGEYKLFVVVGHRPLVINQKAPTLVRLGNWIARLGQQ